MAHIDIVPTKTDLIQQAVEMFIIAASEAIRERGVFSVALSGGSTPRPVYEALGDSANQGRVEWAKVHLFWGDERHVPPTNEQSNYRMVKEALLDRIKIPAENVHRVPAEMEVRMAAFQYEETLRQFFSGEWPRFDFVFLGMGVDGHTASLFPGSAALNEDYRWFVANYAENLNSWRLTLSAPAINGARLILVIVSGEGKAARLRAVLDGPREPYEMPIQMIAPADGEMIWLVDEAAAGG